MRLHLAEFANRKTGLPEARLQSSVPALVSSSAFLSRRECVDWRYDYHHDQGQMTISAVQGAP